MQRVVAVDADTAVDVLTGVDHTLAGEGHPVLGDGDLCGRVHADRQTPQRLLRGEADGLDVDEGIGGTVCHGLERGDRHVELLALLGVVRGEAQGLGEHTRSERALRRHGTVEGPLQGRMPLGDQLGGCLGQQQRRLRIAQRRHERLDAHALGVGAHQEQADGAVLDGGRHEDRIRDRSGRHADLQTGEREPVVGAGRDGRRHE